MGFPFLLLFGGILYLFLLGGILLLRREGLTIRFAVEGLVLIAVSGGWYFLTGEKPRPVIFLLALLLVTLRFRLLIELGRLGMARGSLGLASRAFGLAEWLFPDPASRVTIQFYQGRTCLESGNPQKALRLFQGVLQLSGSASLGSRFEMACHYYLGVAFQRCGLRMQANREYKLILDTWPVSEYAGLASSALSTQAREMLETNP